MLVIHSSLINNNPPRSHFQIVAGQSQQVEPCGQADGGQLYGTSIFNN